MKSGGIRFGPFELFTDRRLLLKDGRPVRLGCRAIELLILLVRNAGRLVSQSDLIAHVWPGVTVEDSNLRVHLGALRRALGDGQRGIRYILTDPGRGYRFVGEIAGEGHRPPGLAFDTYNERATQLPALLTRLVGREKEIATVLKQLRLHRLITIVGGGGIGKSSLALAAAGDLESEYADGCVFVDLAPLSTTGLVTSAVATAMEFPVRTATPLPSLVRAVGGKRLLLVLDSCEHVIEEVAIVVEAMLRGAPNVDILATSREPLKVAGEYLQRVNPLPSPPLDDSLLASSALQFPAAQLFVERALANLDGFELTDRDAPLLARLCWKLDGIPLAIELAAASVDVFGIGGLVTRLDDPSSVLNRGRRTALARHQTLKATLDWSYGILPSIEQAVLRRLSVFHGPFTASMASKVISDSDLSPSMVTDAVANLATKSLVATDVGNETILYRLLDTTRAYAKDLLDQSERRTAIDRRHAEALCDLLGDTEREHSFNEENSGKRIVDDVRSALEWAFSDTGDNRIAVSLTALSTKLWFHFSLLEENRRRIERALEILGKVNWTDIDVEVQLHVAYGLSVWHTTVQAGRMESSFGRALNLAERSKDPRLQLLPLWHLWNARNVSGDYTGAAILARRFGRIAEKLDDSASRLTHQRMLGLSSHFLGNHERARELAESVLSYPAIMESVSRTSEFQFDQKVAARSLLARTLWVRGFPDQALQTVRACIEDATAIEHDMSLCYAIIQSGCPVCAWSGDLHNANRLLSMLLESSAKWPVVYWSWWAKSYKIVFASISQTDLAAAWAHHVRELTFIPLMLETMGTLKSELIDPRVLPHAEDDRISWATPELLRGSGEMRLRTDGSKAEEFAERHFLSAMQMSRKHGSLSWELRAAMSLARLWDRQGRRTEARRILSRAFSRFTEGFETADLRQASLLLGELSNQSRDRTGRDLNKVDATAMILDDS